MWMPLYGGFTDKTSGGSSDQNMPPSRSTRVVCQANKGELLYDYQETGEYFLRISAPRYNLLLNKTKRPTEPKWRQLLQF